MYIYVYIIQSVCVMYKWLRKVINRKCIHAVYISITLNRSFNVKSGDENKKKAHDEAYPNKH